MKAKVKRELGRRLREIREDTNISQRELARRLGISNSFLSDMETGKLGPGFFFLFLISKYFDVNPNYLLHGIEPKFINVEEASKQKETPKELENEQVIL